MTLQVKRAFAASIAALGLTVGSMIGAQDTAHAADSASEIPTLKLGSTGTGVKCVEQMLWVSGAWELPADGIYGFHTQWRVRDFERFFHLPVNMEVEATTGEALFYIAALRGANPLYDPFDIWNAERAEYCKQYVPH